MTLSSSKTLSGRKTYLDFLRIMAIFMVLLNHTNTRGFMLFTVSQHSAFYPVYLFAAVFMKIAVPLFFMISGALLLDKEESYQTLLTKRFLRYLLVLVCASLNLYIYSALRLNYYELSLSDFVKFLYGGKITVAYWYLYTYLAFILMLPLLRKLARGMTNRDYHWSLLVCTALALVQLLQYRITKGEAEYPEDFSFFVSAKYVFYPLMGYFVEKRLKSTDFTFKKLLLLWLASFLSIGLTCYVTHYRCNLTNDWKEATSQVFFETMIFIPAITVFYSVKMWFLYHPPGEKAAKIISTLGSLTFGIYLIERICRMETLDLFTKLKPYLHTFPACIVWIAAACLFGGVCTFILKKIPGVRKFI